MLHVTKHETVFDRLDVFYWYFYNSLYVAHTISIFLINEYLKNNFLVSYVILLWLNITIQRVESHVLVNVVPFFSVIYLFLKSLSLPFTLNVFFNILSVWEIRETICDFKIVALPSLRNPCIWLGNRQLFSRCNILLCYTGDRQKSFWQKINPLTFSQLTNPPMTFHLKQTNIVFSLNRVF